MANEENAHRNNVVELKIPPKTLKRQYKSHSYTVTYIPKTKTWKWTVTVKTEMSYSDEAPTQVKAFRAAERFIDKSCKGS